jgi:hypothetical protein
MREQLRSSGPIERCAGMVVDRLVRLLRFGGWLLLVAELPQQVQRQCRLRQNPDRLGSAYIGRIEVPLQAQNLGDPVHGG